MSTRAPLRLPTIPKPIPGRQLPYQPPYKAHSCAIAPPRHPPSTHRSRTRNHRNPSRPPPTSEESRKLVPGEKNTRGSERPLDRPCWGATAPPCLSLTVPVTGNSPLHSQKDLNVFLIKIHLKVEDLLVESSTLNMTKGHLSVQVTPKGHHDGTTNDWIHRVHRSFDHMHAHDNGFCKSCNNH